ncbi:MAG: hypothetical protein B6D53_03990 [Candidatus Omnitrophica bacterium 4484_49]|nr:MAG: hypothetical protein B6D53_03990 [Candidatus Omnitrophica bacterium 4484_49]
MSYAILGDIHSNLEALLAVLEDVDKNKVEKIFFVGDIVGYGADPSRCIAISQEKFELSVMGNHDLAVLGKMNLSWFNDYARKAIIWTQSRLSREELQYLNSLVLVEEYQDMIFVHGSLYEPEKFHYIFEVHQVHRNFDFQGDKKICFIGHSHYPFIAISDDLEGEIKIVNGFETEIRPRWRYLVNVGSVGQPRDNDPRASYVLYEPEKARIEIKRVEYDIEEAVSKIISKGLPQILGERLYYGR